MMTGARGKWLMMGFGMFILMLLLVTTGAPAAERPPIKVGLLFPYTGTMPLQAKGNTDGAELYFDEIGRKAGGRAIQVIKEDDRIILPWD